MAASPHFIFPTPAAGLRWLLLAALGALSTQCQPATPAEQPAARVVSPDSLKLETAVATPIPKFDVESPILRQLALLPPPSAAPRPRPCGTTSSSRGAFGWRNIPRLTC